MTIQQDRVALAIDRTARYPGGGPCHPPERYPEYPHGIDQVDSNNTVYAMVRDLFIQLGWDAGRLGTVGWNPLGQIIQPGMTVLLKPNLVLHQHLRDGDMDCVITHGSVVRALLDYVCIALQGEGQVVIGDSPLQGTNFEAAVAASGIDRVLTFYRESVPLDLRLQDFRQVHAEMDERHHVKAWKEVPGDSAGYVNFDLGDQSSLAPLAADCHRFRVSNYRSSDTLQFHNPRSHRYVVAGSVIEADVILNIPKMKTHCKAGVTLGLKNFVGTIGRKQCLAHHRHGSTLEGGDEYPDFSRLKSISVYLENVIDRTRTTLPRHLLRFGYRVNERLAKTLGVGPLRDGGWHGNDTVWRMVLDLDRIARYGRPDGTLAETPQRAIFSVVDGVVAGENEGPLEPTPVAFGGLIAGLDLVAVEYVTTTLMGFDPARIPLLREALALQAYPLTDLSVSEMAAVIQGREISLESLADSDLCTEFVPAEGWVGHVER